MRFEKDENRIYMSVTELASYAFQRENPGILMKKFGFTKTTVTPDTYDFALFDGFQKVIFKIVDWVLKYFPIGVFALTAFCFAKFGVALFQSYLQVAGCVISGILLMITVCYPLAIAILCR